MSKCAGLSEATKVLGSRLLIVDGEDIYEYMVMSLRVAAVLKRYGTLQKNGLDEFFVDLTALASAAVADKSVPLQWVGHVVGGAASIPSPGDALLKAASAIAQRMRTECHAATGMTISAGIAHNQLIAKLCASVRKPNAQSVVSEAAVPDYIAGVAWFNLPGVGRSRTRSPVLAAIKALAPAGSTCADLQALPTSSLPVEVRQAVYGRCDAEVVDSGPPKSVGIEETWPNAKIALPSFERVEAEMRTNSKLAVGLVRRLRLHLQYHRQVYHKCVVSWRFISEGYHDVHSASFAIPTSVNDSLRRDEAAAGRAAATLARLATETLRKALAAAPLPLGVCKLGLSAGAAQPTASPGKGSMDAFMRPREAGGDSAAAPASASSSASSSASRKRSGAPSAGKKPKRSIAGYFQAAAETVDTGGAGGATLAAAPAAGPAAGAGAPIAAAGWTCATCTYANADPMFLSCSMCGTARPG